MTKKINCIIDCDPGVDDSVAIALSLYDEVMDIKLITTVNGNLELPIVSRNALHLLEKFKRTDIPVALGASESIGKDMPDASEFHQEEGMGGYIPPKEANLKPISTPAVEAMYEVIKKHPNDIVLIGLGPHTNIALLINAHPDVVGMISHIYCEGCAPYGMEGQGKWTNYISFNASTDAVAMKTVMESGIDITIIPSRMGRELANFTEEEVNKIGKINDVGKFIFDMYLGYWEHDYPDKRIATNDTCAIMALRFPELFKSRKSNVKVNITDQYGRTDFDFNESGKVNFICEVNKDEMHKLYFDAIKKLDFLKF